MPILTGDVRSILDPLSVPKDVKAQAWDAFQNSATIQDFQASLDRLPLPKSAKADLWDAKQSEMQQVKPASSPLQFYAPPPGAGDVAWNQGKAVLQGMASPFTSAYSILTSPMQQDWKQILGGMTPLGMAKSIYEQVKTPVQGAAAGIQEVLRPNDPRNIQAPSDQEWQNAARGQGASLAGLLTAEVPEVPRLVRNAGNAVTSPEALEAAAAANRAPLPKYNLGQASQDAITTGVGGFVGGPAGAAAVEGANLLRRTNLYRGSKAAIQERLANFLAAGDKAPAFNLPTPVEGEYPAPISSQPSTAVGRDMVKALTGGNIPAEAGGSLRPAYSLPENRLPLPSEPATYGQFPGQTQPPAGTGYRPPPDTGLPSVTPPQTAPELNKWMNMKTKQLSHGADPGKQIIAEGLLGADKQATLANAQSALADAGQQLETKLQEATQKGITLDAQTPVYDALNSAMSKLNAPTDEAFTKHINTILDKIETRYPDLSKLSPLDAQKLKIELGDAIKWTSDDPVDKALTQIYGDLNQVIKDNVAGIGRTQDRWASLYQATKALKLSLLKDAIGRGTGAATPKTFPGNMAGRIAQALAAKTSQ